MPYYLHRADITPEALAVSLETESAVVWPPEYSGSRGCDCTGCVHDAWCDYWREHPETPYGVKPNLPPASAPLHLASFLTPSEAHTAKKELQSADALLVSFIPTLEERKNWRERERRKVSSYRYSGNSVVPWRYEDWYNDTLHEMHNAYLSIEKPGLVAYTPSEEWGVADRQLRVRPGKYLEQFAPHLTSTERDAFCAQVKAIDDRNVVQFATTPDDIVRVYLNGPDSCMSHRVGDYSTGGLHPVSVYGDSDLQLAYLPNDDGRTFRARALVWPEKKIHSRVYGDETIKYLLTQMGYKNGSLAGAHVRKVRVDSDVFLMPYVDGIETANIVGNRFQFCDDESGGYKCQDTNGTTEPNYEPEPDEVYYCSNGECGNERNEDHTYCSSCEDERYHCDYCGEDYFDGRSYSVDNYGTMCRACYRAHAHQCEDCADTFCHEAYTRTERREREDADIEETYCLSCGREELARRREEHEENERKRREMEALYHALAHALNTNGLTRRALACRIVFTIGIEVAE